MLQRLFIQNYALINELEITPDNNLNIITGETGAGKSIMLGAIGLLLGNRADTKSLFNENQKCIVEAEFNIKELQLKEVFEDEDIDYDEQTIIRREINSKGKSRAFINDTPCKLDQIKSIGRRLIDIHSQHQTIFLNKSDFQFQLLDGLADTSSLLLDYQKEFKSYSQLIKDKKEIEDKKNQQASDLDYKKFILDELNEANLEDLEIEELEAKNILFENTELIQESIQIGIKNISGDDTISSINSLFNTISAIQQISGLNKKYSNIESRLQGTIEELKDISNELETEGSLLEFNPIEAEEVKIKLDNFHSLTTKHHVNSIDELIELRDKITNELSDVSSYEKKLEELELKIQDKYQYLIKIGNDLSQKRKDGIQPIQDKVNELLQQVGINEGVFKINLIASDSPTLLGIEQIEFLFSANKGIKPELIEKTASGGELSRLMFCLKYLSAQKTAFPTVIFDEIDAGISGEIALKMGELMKKMSRKHQLITITHLPQMASKGSAHYFVYKDQKGEKSLSKIKKLTNEERTVEIAQMIGGSRPSDSALQSAKELLDQKV